MTLEVAAKLPPSWETPEQKKAFYERFEVIQVVIAATSGQSRSALGHQLNSHMRVLKGMASKARARRMAYEEQMARAESGAGVVLGVDPARAVLDVEARWDKDVVGV